MIILIQVTSPWFGAFAFVFFSVCIQHMREVFLSGHNFITWCNEQRFWMIIGLTGQLFAVVNVFLKLVGIGAVNFDLTDKTTNEVQIKRYKLILSLNCFGNPQRKIIETVQINAINDALEQYYYSKPGLYNTNRCSRKIKHLFCSSFLFLRPQNFIASASVNHKMNSNSSELIKLILLA